MAEVINLFHRPKCTVCGCALTDRPRLTISEHIGYESVRDGSILELAFCEEHTDAFLDILVNAYGDHIIRETENY